MNHSVRLLVLCALLVNSFYRTAANDVAIQPIEPAVFETQSITLNCTSTTPPPYTWLRNGMVLSGETGDTLSLTNIPLDWNDSTLTCVVGGIGNTSVTLTVYSASPVFIEHPRSQNVSSGQNFVLSCRARGLPTPIIQWYKDGGVFTLVQPNSEGDLLFISATDEVAGQYRCRANNEHGLNFSDIATITVHFAPELTVQPEPIYNVLNNTIAVLNCSAKGNPAPVYFWYHNGDLITPSDRIEVLDNGTLVIETVTMMDMGMYRCQANNSLGSVDSDDAVLMVDLFPLFRRTPQRTTVAIGDSTVLNCSAIAIPTADYEWTRDGDPVTIDDDRLLLVNGSLVFNQVLRNDSGSYVCFAGNLYGEIMSNPAELIVQGPPLPPTVVLVEAGPTWLFLSWTPNADANPPVSEHSLLYRLSFANTTTELDGLLVQAHNLTSLYPHADYVVQVVSKSPAGPSEPSPPLPNARTLSGLPEGEGIKNGPDELQIEHVSPHYLMVHWTVPEELLRTSYVKTRVYLLNMGSEVISMDSEVSPLNLTGLTPATDYTVELAFLFVGDHMGPRTRRQVTTMDGLPSSPENVMVLVSGPHNLTVTWSVPSQPNGTITAYTVRVLPSNRVLFVGGNDTEVEVDGLEAYTLYTMSVSANTSAGEGPEAVSEATRTAEDVPPPPTGLNVNTVNSTALSLSWQPPANVPGILIGYVIQYNSVTVDLSTTSTVITSLMPYTLYIVRVAAVTGAGSGSFSESMEARTLGDVPTSIPIISAVEPSCPNDLLVTWMNPDPSGLNGPIEEAELVVTVFSGESVYRQPDLQFDSATGGNFTIKNVTHFTNFSVSMAIQNVNGTGDSSNNVTVTSCDALAGPPMDVTVETVNATVVRVAWQPVEQVVGMLIGYIVTYNQEYISTESTSVLLTGLTPYTLYTISVASETRSGPGPSSLAEMVRTDPDVPTSIPTISAVEPSCPNDLLVTWMNPDPSGLNGPVEETVLVVDVVSTAKSREETFQYNSSGSGVVQLTDLTVNTNYTLRVSIRNDVGAGPLSEAVSANTLTEGLSTPPRGPQATTLLPTAIRVSWQQPLNLNGASNYVVSYRIRNAESVGMTVATSSLTVNLTNLQVFTEYEINVSANSSCGLSESSSVVGITGQSPPTAPVDLRVVAVLPNVIVLGWSEPEEPNGAPIEYLISNGSETMTTAALSLEWDDLEPNTEYNFTVTASNRAGPGPTVTTTATTACRAPRSMVMPGSENQLLVSLPPTDVTGCTPTSVLYVLVLVQELMSDGRGGYITPSRSFNDYTLEELKQATRSYDNNRGRRQTNHAVYITANVNESQLENGVMVGDGMDYGEYTNHLLEPGVFYNVGLWGVVAGATSPVFADSPVDDPITAIPPTSPETTTSSLPVVTIAISAGAVAFVLFAILLVACIICACAYCNRRASKYVVANGNGRMERSASFRLSSKRKASDPVDEFRANHRTEALEDHPPVPVTGFINRLMVMRTNDNQLFLEEFGSISMTPQHSTEVADSGPNKRRNRYNNILPYDNNRVKIKTHNGTDYINASYCAGYMKNKAYIATQGPIAETVVDFWRMVWEENVKTVIMLTNVSEKGKVKCEMYWPRDLGCSSMHGHIEVIMDQVTQLADFTIRTFSLHKSGSSKEPRIIKQFHFTSWPDHGVPQYATAMLSMLRRVRSYHSKVTGGPMLVHCSAGVGRTGTFIVVDSMLERLKNSDSLLDIYGHVTLLRAQRNFMVQTEDQYFFIHEAIAEALLCGNTEVTLEGLGGYVTELNTVVSGEDYDTRHIEVQFKRLAVDKNDPYRYVTANKDANKHKNRLVNILPYETNRVVLEYLRGVDGSDYINASHIDSYHNRRAFIATQGPLPHTCGDFWRMVWQYNSPVIVMLTELVEKGQERCSQYWPPEVLQSQTHDRFIVELAVERRSEHYTFRDINITDTQSGQKRCVSHFQFHAWPETGIPATPTILLDFIREVQKMYANLHTKAPITVHCSSGVGRTGVFITLHITLERMVTEGLVDVFQTVKNLRIQRPAMVQTLQQYQFCYESSLHYLESSDLLLTRQRPSVEITRKRSFRHTPPSSQASPARTTTTGTTPSRTDSFKGSSRNFEMSGNQGAHIYGGSEATSTFGSHQHTTNNHSLSGSQVALSGSQTLTPPYGSQSQLYGGSQNNLPRYGGSQNQLNSQPVGGAHLRNTSVGGLGTPHLQHQLQESKRYSNSSVGWGAETQ